MLGGQRIDHVEQYPHLSRPNIICKTQNDSECVLYMS